MLHVVNGESTAQAIRDSGLLQPLNPFLKETRDPDTVVAWKDILFEGPVRAALSPINLAHERSQFIASRGWEPYITIRQDFGRRDSAIASTKRQEEVIFWFESHLLDVLQLVQALDRLAGRRPEETRFSWVLVDRRPEEAAQHGFGRLSTDAVQRLMAARQPVPESTWAEARLAWRTFSSGEPADLQRLVSEGAFAIPFLRDGLERLLAEFPDQATGLSRSEHLVLQALAPGDVLPASIYSAVQSAEARPFLDDLQVRERLNWFATAASPLVDRADGAQWVSPVVELLSLDEPDMEAFHAQRLSLTPTGRDVLTGGKDWLALRPNGRWLGGYEIPSVGAWRYDSAAGLLNPPTTGVVDGPDEPTGSLTR